MFGDLAVGNQILLQCRYGSPFHQHGERSRDVICREVKVVFRFKGFVSTIITGYLIRFHETVIKRIKASGRTDFRVKPGENRIRELHVRHTADVFVTRCRVSPDYGIDKQGRAVFQIQAAPGFGSRVFRHRTRNDMCTVAVRHTAFGRQIHAAAIAGLVLRHTATGHQPAGQHEQSASVYRFVITHHAITDVRVGRHDGTAATGIGISTA